MLHVPSRSISLIQLTEKYFQKSIEYEINLLVASPFAFRGLVLDRITQPTQFLV